MIQFLIKFSGSFLQSLLQFFQGPDGENSSRRLAGLATLYIALRLALLGGEDLLRREKDEAFLMLLKIVFTFVVFMLISGLAEILIKKKYDKKRD